MAVKQSYGIKTPMLSSALDTEITLQKDGVGLKPLPIKLVIITICSGVLCLKATTSSLVSVGTMFQKVLFVVLWILMTILLFMTDKTQRMCFHNVISLMNYIFVKSNRKAQTRSTSPASTMLDICNIKHIDENGTITFADRTYGYMYRVTGTASVLLFDEDKKNIINSVDNFYRKIDSNCEYLYITLKESQKVYNQMMAVRLRRARLNVSDPDLADLCSKQLTMLENVVGKQYQSIHQYMIVKANSIETLTASKITIQNELASNGLFIKRCVPLYQDDILDVLSNIYSAPKNAVTGGVLARKKNAGDDTIKRGAGKIAEKTA